MHIVLLTVCKLCKGTKQFENYMHIVWYLFLGVIMLVLSVPIQLEGHMSGEEALAILNVS